MFTDDKYLAEYVIADDISKQTKTTKCLYRNIKNKDRVNIMGFDARKVRGIMKTKVRDFEIRSERKEDYEQIALLHIRTFSHDLEADIIANLPLCENAALTYVEYEDGKFTVTKYNDFSHIEKLRSRNTLE